MDPEQFDAELPDPGQMRLENEIMRLRLHAEYGAVFPEARPAADDPAGEYHFLKRVLQLHQRIATVPPRPLGEVLDFGRFRPAEALADGPELLHALEEALIFLEAANVIVDFECEYPDRLMYQFVTQELPLLEVIGRPAEDEFICVLYEAFHPNPTAELEAFSIDFFGALIARHLPAECWLYFSEEVPLRRVPEVSLAAVLLLVERFLEYFPRIEAWRVGFEHPVAGPPAAALPPPDCASVSGSIGYRVVHDDGSLEELEGPFRIQVVRLDGLWKIADFDFYGFSWQDKGPDC